MSMTPEAAQLRDFFTSDPATREAMSRLAEGAEIRVCFPNGDRWVVYRSGKDVCFEPRSSDRADVEISIQDGGLGALPRLSGLNLGQLGVEVLKAMARKELKLRVCGSAIRIMRQGYIQLLLSAGPEFTKHLRELGLTSLPKILGAIKKIKTG